MDSIERLDDFVTDKPIDIEIDKEAMDYMDEDPTILMLREEGTHWEPPTIVEATTDEELCMGGSRPPHGGIHEEDQDRQVSHSCQKDQASHPCQEHCVCPY